MMKSHDLRIGTSLVSDQRNRRRFFYEELTPIGGSCGGLKRSFPPPALSERRHRTLARRLVAVRRRAVFVVSESEGPHPGRADRRGGGLHDAADDFAAGEHVIVVVVPMTGQAGSRRALED